MRGGTYYPTATLQSTANGTSSSPVTLTAYGSETVKIDGSNLPDGDWIFKLTAGPRPPTTPASPAARCP